MAHHYEILEQLFRGVGAPVETVGGKEVASKGRKSSLGAAAKPGGAITLPSKPAKKSLKTSRRPKTSRVARTRAGGEWSEARFWSFLRSGLRQMSLRWPPRKQVEIAARRRYNGTNKRRTWEYLCAGCDGWFAGKEIQVDHIEGIGTLKTFSDLPQFCERLFCEERGLRVLCESCHLQRRKKI